ncbi:Methylisocitrate lyase [Pseudonocardia sp. Ae406_Ps2]|uniref:methylisocitrate lyase n=1 Tax=unclassified Pseudonocardia TaxID=2619320 RepID=UPI00094AA4D9|nr:MULTISPECIES: methylisocitrate lyase [unclassified Pseudonocardia]OLL96960.1 Methylisocitrate lyase [Pseudonocardia sp. Ae331_Ps2]OLM05328.1 Methylisocitrate lyase [Pseudonocardia sp. Ae406_Ps2]
MLGATSTPHARRVAFREALASGRLLQFPGAFNALSAMLIAEQGFDGVYVSGAVLSAELGLPDVGLTTSTEVAARAATIARQTDLPVLVDADTGWGGPANVARTVQTFEDAGLAGCHLEDQVDPKRCGHLAGKALVPTEDMCTRVRAAVRGRRDDAFVLCARTDARAVDGLDAAIDRARAYMAAGADMIFAEALTGEDEYAAFRDALDVPLLANMTEFGKSPLLTADTLEKLGVNVVIYPVTLLRLAMGAAEAGLAEIRRTGTQAGVVDRMLTRARLYELLHYDEYGAFDAGLAGYLDEEDPS